MAEYPGGGGVNRTPYDRSSHGGTGSYGAGGKVVRSSRSRNNHLQQQKSPVQGQQFGGGAIQNSNLMRRGPYDRPNAGRHASAGPQAAARRTIATRAANDGTWGSRIFNGASSFLTSFFRKNNEQPLAITNSEEENEPLQNVGSEEDLDIESMLSEGAFSREQCHRLIKILQSKHASPQALANGLIEERAPRLYPEDELAREVGRRISTPEIPRRAAPPEIQRRTPEMGSTPTDAIDLISDIEGTSPADLAKAYMMDKPSTPIPPSATPFRSEYRDVSIRKFEFDPTPPRVRIATPGHTPFVRLPRTRLYDEFARPTPYSGRTNVANRIRDNVANERKRRANDELDQGRKTRHKVTIANGPPTSTFADRMKNFHNKAKPVAEPAEAPVPMQSTETANKILEALEKMTPPMKGLEDVMVMIRDKRPEELSPSKLNEQARRTMQAIEFPEIPVEQESLPPSSSIAGPSSEGLLRPPPPMDVKGKGITEEIVRMVPEDHAGTSQPPSKGFRMNAAMEESNSEEDAFRPLSKMPPVSEASAKPVDKQPSIVERPIEKMPSAEETPSKAATQAPVFPFAATTQAPAFPFAATTQAPAFSFSSVSTKRQMVETTTRQVAETSTSTVSFGEKPPFLFGSQFGERNSPSLDTSSGKEVQPATSTTPSTSENTTEFSFPSGPKPVDVSETSIVTAKPQAISIFPVPIKAPDTDTPSVLSTKVPDTVATSVLPTTKAPDTTTTSSFPSIFAQATKASDTTSIFATVTKAPDTTSIFATVTKAPDTTSVFPTVTKAPDTSIFQAAKVTDTITNMFPPKAPADTTTSSLFPAVTKSPETNVFAPVTKAPDTISPSAPTLTKLPDTSALPSFSTTPAKAPETKPIFPSSNGLGFQTSSNGLAPFQFGGTTSSSPVFDSPNGNNDMMEDAEEQQQQPQTSQQAPSFVSPSFVFSSGTQSSGSGSGFAFGQTPPSTAFGSSSSFTTSFSSQSGPSFGGTGAAAASQSSMFHFSSGSSASPFGVSTTPAFGSSSTPSSAAQSSGSVFPFTQGTTSAGFQFGSSQSITPFGAQSSTPAFGTPQSSPAFGGPSFGQFGSAPSFGSSQAGFGVSQSAPVLAFGAQPALPQPSLPNFGSTPAAFGTPPQTSFGNSQATFGSAPAFGAGQAPQFGAPPAPQGAPDFGGTGGGFGFSMGANGGTTDNKSARKFIKAKRTGSAKRGK